MSYDSNSQIVWVFFAAFVSSPQKGGGRECEDRMVWYPMLPSCLTRISLVWLREMWPSQLLRAPAFSLISVGRQALPVGALLTPVTAEP